MGVCACYIRTESAVLDAASLAHFPLAAVAARRRLLQMHYEAQVGHIGGNLSALDSILYLLGWTMRKEDTFVLSKGHAAGALYIALWALGRLDDTELSTFHKDGTRLAGHPVPHGHRDIAFATGSLGHGLGLAAGVALGKRLRDEPGRVFCLLSDGECQEGSTFEALTFARHHDLSNLVVMVDANGLQGFGTTREVASLDRLAEWFRGLGLRTLEIDGHNEASLHDATVVAPNGNDSGPLTVVMQTIKGCGVSFMENRLEWHYLPLDATQYEQALLDLATRELRELAALGRAPRKQNPRRTAARRSAA